MTGDTIRQIVALLLEDEPHQWLPWGRHKALTADVETRRQAELAGVENTRSKRREAQGKVRDLAADRDRLQGDLQPLQELVQALAASVERGDTGEQVRTTLGTLFFASLKQRQGELKRLRGEIGKKQKAVETAAQRVTAAQADLQAIPEDRTSAVKQEYARELVFGDDDKPGLMELEWQAVGDREACKRAALVVLKVLEAGAEEHDKLARDIGGIVGRNLRDLGIENYPMAATLAHGTDRSRSYEDPTLQAYAAEAEAKAGIGWMPERWPASLSWAPEMLTDDHGLQEAPNVATLQR